jgi:hypothetical protein
MEEQHHILCFNAAALALRLSSRGAVVKVVGQQSTVDKANALSPT